MSLCLISCNYFITSLYRPDVIGLMKQTLPTYIVNCFIATGFDTLEAITEMDVSSSPKNSIRVIEEYINRRKVELLECIRPNSSSIFI